MDFNFEYEGAPVVTHRISHVRNGVCTFKDNAGRELKKFIPQRPGYTFVCWAKEDGTEFMDGSKIPEPPEPPEIPEVPENRGSMTIYAQWYCDGEHDLVVTEDPEAGTRTVDCTRCDYESTTETVVVSDYTGVFDGQPHSATLSAPAGVDVTWYKDAGCTDPYDEQPSFTETGTYTVYYKAVWNDAGDHETGSATVTIEPLDLGNWVHNRVYAYDGTEKSPYSDKLSTYFDVTGITRTANPGEYLVTCKLKSEYVGNVKWSVTDVKNSATAEYPAGSDSMTLVWAIEGSPKEPVTLSFAESVISRKVSDFSDSSPEVTVSNQLHFNGAPESVAVSYTSSKPHVATVDDDGNVTLHAVGNTKITAKYAGDETHEAASASYIVSVTSDAEENHAFVYEPETPPTCVEVGHTAGKLCRVCGKRWESTVIPATGVHTPAGAVRENVAEATYDAPGSYDSVVYCSVCHLRLSSTTVVIPQLTSPPASAPEPSGDDSDDDSDDDRDDSSDDGYGAPIKVTPTPPEPYENPFVDVAGDAYYAEAVRWANETGVTTGLDATHFAPDRRVTRAQAVTFLWRAAGMPAPHGGPSVFEDVELGSYYEPAVAWALEQGITKGTSATTFSPDQTCTRAQIVTLLARYSGVRDTDTETHYSDVAPNDYFAASVRWAEEAHVTNGAGDGLFHPYDGCTRGQIVTFLWRLAA